MTIGSTILFSMFVAVAAFASDASAAEAKAGKRIYERRCASCHGPGGGGTDKGPPLVHEVYRPSHHGDFAFHLAVRNGVRAHHWRFGDMPPVRGLSKEDVDAIVRYIRRLQKEAGIF